MFDVLTLHAPHSVTLRRVLAISSVSPCAVRTQVAIMYRHMLKLPSSTRILLEPFNIKQTKALMQVGHMTHAP